MRIISWAIVHLDGCPWPTMAKTPMVPNGSSHWSQHDGSMVIMSLSDESCRAWWATFSSGTARISSVDRLGFRLRIRWNGDVQRHEHPKETRDHRWLWVEWCHQIWTDIRTTEFLFRFIRKFINASFLLLVFQINTLFLLWGTNIEDTLKSTVTESITLSCLRNWLKYS